MIKWYKKAEIDCTQLKSPPAQIEERGIWLGDHAHSLYKSFLTPVTAWEYLTEYL